MATDIEKKKQGMQTYQDFPVPAPQAAANQTLGNVANTVKDAVVGPPSIMDRVKGLGSTIKQGYDSIFQAAADKGNAAISKSAETIDLGNRLTKAVPLFGSTTPAKDIAVGLKDSFQQFGRDVTTAADRYAGGAGVRQIGRGLSAAFNRVKSDYDAMAEYRKQHG